MMADGTSLHGIVRPIIHAKSLVMTAAAIPGMPPAFSRCDDLTVPMWSVRTELRASKLTSGSASTDSFRQLPNVSIRARAGGGLG